MKKKPSVTSVSHDRSMIDLMRQDREFAVECLRVALEEIGEDGGDLALLKTLRHIAEAQGISNIAKAAGIPRETLSRALSSHGNPRFSTLSAVINAMGLRLTVQADLARI